ncbi:uncharacterized protein LOC116021595 isoform X1 [Ipomoea triloba]|uniref:uncharacterized protein LOC116021595 isoform X1 n=1 Tax=Ipomoea triloba TaxID=35885 RepID=UPI00125E1FDA|nr:uncharacterized protein LOC116021595 isoform X1 [Ipomoea triloba]GLL16753.1 uncharacterized protein LOC109184400 isoform X1 [Ipomoea trifida]GMC46516.1 DUF724 domain-containing protein [Ipomoea batatas]GMC56845.1 DUF724 domain-containing protein [Ipomoea batatas]
MKFKRGVKVEVMNKAEVPVSWRTAEILSGDGHTYIVRFDSLVESESMVERVWRRLIRPSPPIVQHTESWLAGDILEVFDDFSWKVAIVLYALEGDYYFVRLLGSSHEFSIHISSMRRRQAWQDGKWVLMSKVSSECGKVNTLKLSTPIGCQKSDFQLLQSDVLANFQGESRLQESHAVSSRSLKRASPYCSSAAESHTIHFQKLRAAETNGQRQRLIPSPVLEKVDAVAYPRETLGENYMHASFNIGSTRYNEIDKAKLDGVFCFSSLRNSELSDSDSDACSVGSCSVTSESPVKFRCHFLPNPLKSSDAFCSDAESVCHSVDEEESIPPPEEDLAESIHRLELHAYHCTLEALYASGPLTWEQETMLTNLRITLHISNDEHLMELKNLISAKSCSYLR